MVSTNFGPKLSTTVDVNLENAIVTYKSLSRVLLSIIEFLSFNRNQIPFVYQTFDHLTQKFERFLSSNEDSEISASVLALNRQRELAISTNNQFKQISDILAKFVKIAEIEQSIILFGATPFTAKEAFIVNLPPVSRNHSVENHQNAPQEITKKVILKMIASTEFFDKTIKELKLTNMFVFLKPRLNGKIISANENDFKLHEDFRLPSKCQTILINIENGNDNCEKCCRNLSIFNETELNEDCAMEIETEEPPTKEEETETAKENNCDEYFYECRVSVKGFNAPDVKGKNIWSNE